ncbi:hypothetical protein [Sulfitobacter sp.]|uniref:hypothetical protein n=1 Tax=Sulfitobacter sp. TaxID=1903071 RepID=UPI003002E6E4
MAGNEVAKADGGKSLSLDTSKGQIDISGLSEEAQQELTMYAARKQIDLQSAMQKLSIDLQGTSSAVNNMADVTRRMTESGDANTTRITLENSAGKTEVIMGNTDEAKRGNVDKKNDTWMYIVGGIVVLMIVASVLSS